MVRVNRYLNEYLKLFYRISIEGINRHHFISRKKNSLKAVLVKELKIVSGLLRRRVLFRMTF